MINDDGLPGMHLIPPPLRVLDEVQERVAARRVDLQETVLPDRMHTPQVSSRDVAYDRLDEENILVLLSEDVIPDPDRQHSDDEQGQLNGLVAQRNESHGNGNSRETSSGSILPRRP